MVVIEDDSLRLETVCSPLQVRLARAAELARLGQLGDDRVSGCPLAAACTRLTRPLANHPPLAVPPRRDRHPGGGQRQLPPSFAAVGYAPCFKGFGCATPPLLIPIRACRSTHPGDRVHPRGSCSLPDPDLAPPSPRSPPGTTSRRRIGRQPRRRLFRPARERRLRPPAARSNTSPSSRTSSSPPTATTPRASTSSTFAIGPRNR